MSCKGIVSPSRGFHTEHFKPTGQYCRWTHVIDTDISATGCETLLLLLLSFTFFSLREAINSCSVSPSDSTKAAHLCVLVSVTAVNYVSLLAQTPHYCGLCKVAIVLSQFAGGTNRRCKITCFHC